MENRKPELALPAGSLQCALYAFKGGADAVYLGLKAFSARKNAVNFSFDDLRKLRRLCDQLGTKFYVTLNTLLSDAQLPEAVKLLRRLEHIGPDGIIVQDLGLARIIRMQFPTLALHGSTQLAVHTVEGVRALADMGFSRVVLSRELSLEEIANIREQCPDVELKVFIHGALCYGFSGVCAASQMITGRSANRGECAQVCRTWFTCKETGKDAWLFSMKDLCLGHDVLKLRDIGIDSFKVEGRMKGPDYVYWCARYYRLILDGVSQRDDALIEARERMETAFARERTAGFFNTGKAGSCGCESMVSPDFPSHRGIEVGRIVRTARHEALVRFSRPVALRDGLLVIFNGKSAQWGLSSIDEGRSYVNAGDTAMINFPASDFPSRVPENTPVMCVSRHNMNMEILSENLPPYRNPISVKADILPDAIVLNGMRFSCTVDESRSGRDIRQAFFDVLSSSDRSHFTCEKLELVNSSGFNCPFIPLSALKEIRRNFYAALDKQLEDSFDKPWSADGVRTAQVGNFGLPARSALGLWGEIRQVDGKKWMCLPPVMFDEEGFFKGLSKTLDENPDLVLGLNNIAQARWIMRNRPNQECFADIWLYAHNSVASGVLADMLPGLIGSVEIENVDKDFKVPLFVSRVCMRHNGLGLPCKGCSRDNTYNLEQSGRKYVARCKDCMTILV